MYLDQERFNKYVTKTDSCWLWNGARCDGYGVFALEGKVARTHRISYTLHKGPIPDGMCVCHSCDVRNCINPDHLWLGTYKDNHQDMADKGRRVARTGSFILTETDLKQIRDLLKSNLFSQKTIASWYNTSQFTISRVKRNTY